MKIMKINLLAQNVKVLTKSANPSKDGTATYYNIGIMCGSELGNISCSQEVYDLVELDKVCDIVGIYNSEYKSFKFEKVATLPTGVKH